MIKIQLKLTDSIDWRDIENLASNLDVLEDCAIDLTAEYGYEDSIQKLKGKNIQITCSNYFVRFEDDLFKSFITSYYPEHCYEGNFLKDNLSKVTELTLYNESKTGAERYSFTTLNDLEKFTNLTKLVLYFGQGSYTTNSVTSIKLPSNLATLGENNRLSSLGVNIEKIELPDSLQYIYTGLSGLSKLTALTIPKNVKIIKSNDLLTSLKTVSIESTALTELGNLAFGHAYNLTDINLPDTITTIGQCAFLNCFKLASNINLPNLSSIALLAFLNCYDLLNVISIGNVTTIPQYCFLYCKSLVLFPFAPVTKIDTAAFLGTSFENVDIQLPNCIELGQDAFKASNYKSITFGSNFTTLGITALSAISHQTVYDLSNTALTTLGNQNWRGNSYVEEIDFPKTLQTYADICYNAAPNLKKLSFSRESTEITVPELNIYSCKNLTELDLNFEEIISCNTRLPSSLTKINGTLCSSSEKYLIDLSKLTSCSAGNSLFGTCPSVNIQSINPKFSIDTSLRTFYYPIQNGEYIGLYANPYNWIYLETPLYTNDSFLFCGKGDHAIGKYDREEKDGITVSNHEVTDTIHTKLGGGAFAGNQYITKYTNTGATNLSTECFSGCCDLQELIIPNAEVSPGWCYLSGAMNLYYLEFKKGITGAYLCYDAGEPLGIIKIGEADSIAKFTSKYILWILPDTPFDPGGELQSTHKFLVKDADVLKAYMENPYWSSYTNLFDIVNNLVKYDYSYPEYTLPDSLTEVEAVLTTSPILLNDSEHTIKTIQMKAAWISNIYYNEELLLNSSAILTTTNLPTLWSVSSNLSTAYIDVKLGTEKCFMGGHWVYDVKLSNLTANKILQSRYNTAFKKIYIENDADEAICYLIPVKINDNYTSESNINSSSQIASGDYGLYDTINNIFYKGTLYERKYES